MIPRAWTLLLCLAGCSSNSSWEPAIQVDTVPREQLRNDCPRVVVLDDGDAAMVYTQQLSGIWFRRYLHSADAWESPVQLADGTWAGTCPGLAADAAGNLVVAWTAPSELGTSAIWTRSLQPGSGWTDPELVDVGAQLLEVAMTRQGDAVLTVVHDIADGPTEQSTSALLRPSGGSWGTEHPVNDPGFPVDELLDAQVAGLPGAVRLVLTWLRTDPVDNSWVTSVVDFDLGTGEAAVGAADPIDTFTTGDRPSVGIDGTGALKVIWQGADGNLWLRQRTQGWSEPTQLAGRGSDASIAVDDDGSAVVAWTTASSTPIVNRRRFDGTEWASAEELGPGVHPRVAVHAGHSAIGWTAPDYLVAQGAVDGGPTSLMSVDADHVIGVPAVAVGRDGTAVVALARLGQAGPQNAPESVLFVAVRRGD
jgi:hypothetical protein